MEKIYTIPVNEAFEKGDGCPFCTLAHDLETKELEAILGAAMMEPDVRTETNKKGFCAKHYQKMYAAQKRLPLALILESGLEATEKALKPAALSLRDKTESVAHTARALAGSCYVCDRVEFHLAKMFHTATYLYEQDAAFRKKLSGQPLFCLEHYARLLETAKSDLSKKRSAELFADARAVEEGFLASLRTDMSKFCQKFDYRFSGEPWGEEKNAIERAMKLYGADLGEKK